MTVASAPASSSAATPSPVASATEGDRAAVARGDSRFAARLYRRLPSDKNLFFSPTSIRMALAMAYAGAKAETERQMADVLEFKADAETIHRGFAAELREFADASSAPVPQSAPDWQKSEAERARQTLRVANRLWGQEGRHFLPGFLAVLRDDYAAPLGLLDFAAQPGRSRTVINAFIRSETEGRIPELLGPRDITAGTTLVVTNAVYFKATWGTPFLLGQTTRAPFFASSARTVTADLMTLTSSFRYGAFGDAMVLELPYASGRMSMLVALPSHKDSLGKLEASLDGGALDSWANRLSPARVHVTLPKFRLASDLSLANTLSGMGMPLAFDAHAADFSGMDGTHELYIGEAIHKAVVAVDEQGTEAAAATALAMPAGAAMHAVPPVEFRADHPFVFWLREAKTGSVLFMGRVVDPTE